MDLKGIRVGVLAGGASEEREISLLSGKQVFSSLRQGGVRAVLIDLKSSRQDQIKKIIKKEKIDLAFIALHGAFGEDGSLQRILEKISLAYTGSNPEASRLAMDKIASKKRFKQEGVPVAGFQIFSGEKNEGQSSNNFPSCFPVVVKPNSSGSSFGVSIVKNKDNFWPAVKSAFNFSNTVIAEDYIEGPELTVGILNNKPLAVVEIIPKGEYFGFESKYTVGGSNFIVPAKLESRVYKRVQEVAQTAHKALGCRDFSRVDIKLKGKIPYVLEINSIPGFTSKSLLPLSALACGIDFGKMIQIIIGSVLARSRVQAGGNLPV